MDGGPWMEQEHTHTGKMFLPYPHHSILHEHKEPEMTAFTGISTKNSLAK